MKKLLYVLLAMTFAFAMVGCGGDDDDDNNNQTPPVLTPSIAITGGAGSVGQGKTLQFGAQISNSTETAVTWSLSGNSENGTTLSSTGLLSVDAAESINSTLVVKVELTNDSTLSATRNVSVIEVFTISFYQKSDKATLLKTLKIESEVSIDNAGLTLPKTPNLGENFKFKEWTNGTNAVTGATEFQANGDVWATYYDGDLSSVVGALEKVYNEDTALPLYEFDLSSYVGSGSEPYATVKDLFDDIIGIDASYAVSEAFISVGAPRLRAFGPYFFNGTEAVELDTAKAGNDAGSKFWGDFKIDKNGKPVARLAGDGGGPTFPDAQPDQFNKFQAYLIDASGNAWGPPVGSNAAPAPTAGQWWSHSIVFNHADPGDVAGNGYSWGKTLRLLGDGYFGGAGAGKIGSTQILAATTDFTKVYFGVGLMRSNSQKVVDTADSVWDHGYVYLIKDVKLVLGKADKDAYEADDDYDPDDPFEPTEFITGAIPNLAATTDDNYNAANTTQVFTGYVNPVEGSWRGLPTATVTPFNSPDYVPPSPLPEPPNGSQVIFDSATDTAGNYIQIFGNLLTKASDGTITLDNPAGTMQTWDVITFEVPSAWADYAWDELRIEYTANIDAVSESRAQFSTKAGLASSSYDNQLPSLAFSGSSYPNVSDGSNTYTVAGGANLLRGALATSDGKMGVTMQVNNNAASNVPQKYTIKFTKITMIAP
jgi:hypothetical protein